MARTVEELVQEHKGGIDLLSAAVERLKDIRKKVSSHQSTFEKEIVPTSVVQSILEQHPLTVWWNALAQTNAPPLQDIYQEGRRRLQAQLTRQQQLLHKGKTLQAELVNFELQLDTSDKGLRAALRERDEHSLMVAQTSRQREANHDAWLTAAMPRWSKDPQQDQTPMHRNYAQPRAWWEPLWLVRMVQPQRHTYIRDAMAFEKESGLSLFATAQGYPERHEAWLQARDAWKQSVKHHEDLVLKNKYLHLAIDTHTSDLNIVRQQLQPNSGAVLTAEEVQKQAMEQALRFCGMVHLDALGDLPLRWPQDGTVQGNIARNAAMTEMLGMLDTTMSQSMHSKAALQEGLRRLHDHDAFSLSGTSVDMNPVQTTLKQVQQSVQQIDAWLKCLENDAPLPIVSAQTLQVAVPKVAVPALDDAPVQQPMGILLVSGPSYGEHV